MMIMKLLSNIVILLSILLLSCQTTKEDIPNCKHFDQAYIKYIEKIGFIKSKLSISEDLTKIARSAQLVHKGQLIAVSFEFFIQDESKKELERLKTLNASFAGRCFLKNSTFNVYYLTVTH